MIRKVLRVPKAIYNNAVSIVTFPRKYRHQNHRIFLLEESLDASNNQLQALTAHMPTILNHLTSCAHTSRELTINYQTLNDSMAKLQEQLEFIRSEILFESVCKEPGKAAKRSKTEHKIINKEKLSSMGDDIRINMGCGHTTLEDYLNLDPRELPGVDVVSDVTDMPFAENSVAELFSSHLIEHFPQEELQSRLLPYWFSLLKPGGVFRALLPDWESMIVKYTEGSLPFDNLREATFGAQDNHSHFHFNMFSQDSLRSALEDAGFGDVSFPVSGRSGVQGEEIEVRALK